MRFFCNCLSTRGALAWPAAAGSLIASALLLLLIILPAVAESLLNEGIDFYKKGQYSRARDFFHYIVEKEPHNWQAQYELANTYMKMNDPALAKSHYSEAQKTATDPKVARICGQMIAFIDHSTGVKQYEGATLATSTAARPAPTAGATTSGTPGHVEFKHRIYVVTPQFNHPAVSQVTIDTVTRVVDTLPANIYEALDAGGATVNISPNITDKWPDMLKGKLDAEGLHLAQDAARCYGKDVYIYERQLIPNTTQVGDIAFDSESVTNVLYHELGHALDASSGSVSDLPEVVNIYKTDMGVMSDDTKHRLWYYTKENGGIHESFAEVFAGLMGANGKDTEEVRNAFPNYRRYIKNRFKL